jgi:MFS family permease
MGARFIDGVFFNIFGVYSIAFLTSQLKVPRTEALLGVTAAALIMCPSIPLFGRMSDKFGRTRVYGWGSLITGLSALPAFWIWSAFPDQPAVVWIALIVPFGILYASIYGPEAALFCDLFKPQVRYTGISFVYQFSGIFASGLTPIVATALVQAYGGNGGWAIAMYCVFAGVVSALSAAWILCWPVAGSRRAPRRISATWLPGWEPQDEPQHARCWIWPSRLSRPSTSLSNRSEGFEVQAYFKTDKESRNDQWRPSDFSASSRTARIGRGDRGHQDHRTLCINGEPESAGRWHARQNRKL